MLKKILFSTAVLCLLLTPVFTYASIDNNLYYGLQKNGDVKQLQEFLIDKGFLTGSATGNFFSLTLKAVKAYQSSAGINSTGYVGTLTRAAINNELAVNLSASNQESTTETGTTPPTPTLPATTNDVVAQLQAQIALLQKQLDALNSQQTTLNQIQQNTQQIAQNTTSTPPPTICTPNWQCAAWSTCANSQQTRTCSDTNNCNTYTGEPSLSQSCTVAQGQPKLIVQKNTAFSDQVCSGNKVGSFILSNQSTESIVINSINATSTPVVNLRVSGALNLSPTATMTPGEQVVEDVSGDCTSAQALQTSLAVSYTGVSSGISITTSPVAGQTITSAMGIVATIVASSTTPAQSIVSSGNGATNAAQATFNFTSNNGPSIINVLQFAITGSDGNPSNTVTNICITPQQICLRPVSGVADFILLNLAVPSGSTGLNQTVSISYAAVGTNAVTSGTTSSIALIYVGGNGHFTTNISAPTMTLINPNNVPPTACTPNWQCSGFSTCVNGQLTQTCNDTNNCNTTNGEPALTQSCTQSVPPPPTPAIGNVIPNVGSATGGTSITINGTGFANNATVTIGGNPATSVTVVNSTQLTAITPAGTVGPQQVDVINPYGSGGEVYTTLSGGFTYQ